MTIELLAQEPFLLSGAQSGLAGVISFSITFIVLFAVPFSISIAGGVTAKAQQFLSRYGEKITEVVKGNPNDPNSNRNKTRRALIGGAHIARANVIRQGDRDDATTWQKARGKFAGSFIFPSAERRVSAINKEATEMREALTGYGEDRETYAGSGYSLGRGTIITQGMQSTLLGYDGQAAFSTSQVGTALGEKMNFDSKGRRITDNLFTRGKRLEAATNSDVAEGIGYAFGKAQTDRERSAARMAFAQNALQSGWTQTEVNSQWAKAVYGKKDIDATQWYSKPTLETNAGTGQRQVRFKDVSDDLDAYDQMTEEFNQSRTSFAITPDRDGVIRTAYQRQRELEGKALSTGSLSQKEHRALVKTHQIIDSVSSRMMGPQYDDSGQMISAQGTPESQAVIKAALNDRKLRLTDYDPNDGTRKFEIPPPKGAPQGTPPLATIGIDGGLPRPAVTDAANRPNVARIV